MTSQLSLIYTTFSNEEDAMRIARELLEKRVVACMNLLGSTRSLCFWEGRFEESQEVSVLFKTTSEKTPQVIKALQELHPYEVPAILEIPIGRGAKSFCRWVEESVR